MHQNQFFYFFLAGYLVGCIHISFRKFAASPYLTIKNQTSTIETPTPDVKTQTPAVELKTPAIETQTPVGRIQTP